MTWLEVSLAVNGELAEAVVEVLARFAPNGVATEQGVRYASPADEGTPDGPVTVRAYIPVDEKTERTRLKIEESLHYLGMIQSLPAPEFTLVADQNWMEAWKRHYKPLAIGRRLMIVPAWLDVNQAGRIPIRINPGMAFGTGTHPSTQLCLGLIEDALDAHVGQQHGADDHGAPGFIDVGCGSGILSIAALKLGATFALGVDIDPDSITNARENAALNGIGSELVLGVGSLKDILEGKFPNRTASVVAVNILAPVIVRLLAEGLAQLAQEGGALVLGGILQEQAESVLWAAGEANITLVECCHMGDWIALRMRR